MSVEKCVQEILLTVRRLENAIDENQRRTDQRFDSLSRRIDDIQRCWIFASHIQTIYAAVDGLEVVPAAAQEPEGGEADDIIEWTDPRSPDTRSEN